MSKHIIVVSLRGVLYTGETLAELHLDCRTGVYPQLHFTAYVCSMQAAVFFGQLFALRAIDGYDVLWMALDLAYTWCSLLLF